MLTAEIPRIRAQDLKARLDRGEAVTVVDVRKAAAFEECHIQGALSLPVSNLDSRFKELPPDRAIVCY